MFGTGSVVPRDCRRSVSVSDREIVGQIRSDPPRCERLQIRGAELSVIASGKIEASEADDQAGDEGSDVGVDAGHRAG